MTNQPIRDQMDEADLIVHNAKVTTLQDNGSEADAFADRGERFVAVGDEAEIMRLRGNRTRLIDVGGRRVIPGLNDSHLHAIRGGLFYNLELRWDGVQSLQRGVEMIRDQAKRTPEDQWVVPLPVQGEEDADRRGVERCGFGHAGLRPVRLQPGPA